MAKNPGDSTQPHEVLVPYTDFAANDLARQLNGLAIENAELLSLRGIRGVTERYGSDLETAEANVRKGQADHESLGSFAIVSAMGDVCGLGSVYPNLPLKEQRVPLPPVLARGPLATTYPKRGPNVHAWTGEGYLSLLADAYKGLMYRAAAWWRQPEMPRVWTVEPTRSPNTIHHAITDSGLIIVRTGRFDDGESKSHIPPLSTLYTRVHDGRLL